MAKKKRPILTAEEEAWAAGYDDRTREMLALLGRRRAALKVRKEREERRRRPRSASISRVRSS